MKTQKQQLEELQTRFDLLVRDHNTLKNTIHDRSKTQEPPSLLKKQLETRRDMFACIAMGRMVEFNCQLLNKLTARALANLSYDIADAMIERREQ